MPLFNLAIIGHCCPIGAILLFAALFVPLYVVNHKKRDIKLIVTNNTEVTTEDEYDEYEENIINITHATLTPKNGYDNILIFLGGISDFSSKYFDFFKSTGTYVPKGTKIYFLSGQPRTMQFMIDYYNSTDPVPGWFNIDWAGNLVPEGDYSEAKVSLNLVLNEIDRIKNEENVDYKNIIKFKT